MLTFVLDTSAVLRFLDDEAGAGRVSEFLQAHAAGDDRIIMSAIHCGEVIGVFYKRSQPGAVRIEAKSKALRIEPVAAGADRAARSALIKAKRGIPYFDAFGVELAADSPRHCLLTADFDVKPAEQDVTIEFLPAKPKK